MTRRNQQGFTLIELMIALFIGLILLGGLLQALLASRSGFEMARDLAHLQENARLAEHILDHAIAHAGYHPVFLQPGTPLFPRTEQYEKNAYIATRAGSGRHNVLRLRFRAIGHVRDCLGGKVGSAGSSESTDFEFFINGNHTLECRKYQGAAQTTQPIVENAQYFAVRYGLDTDNDLAVDRYTFSPSPEQALRILSIRYQLLLRSDHETAGSRHPARQSYEFMDGTLIRARDHYQRVLIDRTVALQNPPL